MRLVTRALLLAPLGLAAALLLRADSGGCVPLPARPRTSEAEQLMRALPSPFVPNLGQWEHAARYVTRIGAMTVFLEDAGWTFTVSNWQGVEERAPETGRRRTRDEQPRHGHGVAVRMTFEGARRPELVPQQCLPGVHHYFLGDDPERWRSDVPLYGAVRYCGVRPGVDVRARQNDGHFEYDLLLEPGAALDQVEIAVEGVEHIRLDPDGSLVLETTLGPVKQAVPKTWEEGPSGEKYEIACCFVLRDADRFAFETPERRPGWALVVDPGLMWSTFLGGADDDRVYALAVDAQGAVTVAGATRSASFPTTPGAFDTTHNGGGAVPNDVFVTRLAPSGGSLLWSTFLGGNSDDLAWAVGIDAVGAAAVTGRTQSVDFPTTPGALDTTHNGYDDAFVVRLSSSGSSLVYSTFLGGAAQDRARAIAVDSHGVATVAGRTSSPTFPTTPGAFDTTHNFASDAFVARLSSSGSSLVYSTFLGGNWLDEANAVAVDAQGASTIGGWTSSVDFPTTSGAFDTTYNGRDDAFVARLSPSGSSLVYSTFLGDAQDEQIRALAVDTLGAATVVGVTVSASFPTTPGAFDPTYNGQDDVFVTRLSLTGSSLVYSTYLGGVGNEWFPGIALDAQGAATVVGRTSSRDFPTTRGSLDPTHNGAGDAFVTRLSASGSLIYSTFFGGPVNDEAWAVAVDTQGVATVAGATDSASFPTTPGAFDTSYNGGFDAFVARIDMLPTGVRAFGASSPGCEGPLAIGVTAMPGIGTATFALGCGNAPPNASGGLALGARGLTAPLFVLGAGVWIDPIGPWFLVTGARSDTIGAASVRLPIPNTPGLVGQQLSAQFLWVGPSSPPPCPALGVSASNALEITIQP